MKAGVIGVLALVLGLGAYVFLSGTAEETPQAAPPQGDALAAITLPEALGPNAKIGQRVFQAKCADCHGVDAVGVDGSGPPLVHKIYEPSHHADEAFQRAVQLGVRSHHWRFGDMPAVDGLTRGDVTMIVAYIRELQRENGIF
ncbi:c-type cytochrome [Shimia sediminis]|uniref:c-type cytochrome n=1 Tax=Shimia sediminis TaxID=2497945 RepID=UPI000F8E5BDA|nr:cytochrome c [Shimia sediminis]